MSDKPVSTWTRFQAPLPPDDSRALDTTSIFEPLIDRRDDYHDAFYGRIAESHDQCVLVVAWKSSAVCDAFAASPSGWRQLLANIAAAVADTEDAVGESEPSHQQQKKQDISLITRKVDFGKIGFWSFLKSNTEVRTVYFRPAANSEQSQQDNLREEVMSLKGLGLSMGLGIDGRLAHLSPHRAVPTRGWVIGEAIEEEKKGNRDDGSQASEFVTWEGRQVYACLWIHYWKDREAEKRFKSTETRPESRQLATKVFDDALRHLGAIGWEDYHVDFEKVPKTLRPRLNSGDTRVVT